MSRRTDVPSSPDRDLEPPWAAAVRSARATRVPGLVLLVVALAVVVAYFHHAPTRAVLDGLAAFRERVGLLYGAVATALFGGLIPYCYLRATGGARRHPWSHLGFYLVFWAYKGVEVDLFYRAQAALWGDDSDFLTIAAKVVTDMGVYCPLWAVPFTVVPYAWKDVGFDAGRTLALFRDRPWRRRFLPAYLSNLSVWLPAVCLVYALPLPLQLPLFNFVLCFYTLLFAHLSAHASGAATDAQA